MPDSYSHTYPQCLAWAFAVSASVLSSGVQAEEGGSGHYLPGAMASFIDELPGKEAFGYLNGFTYYNGSIGGSGQLKLGGNIVAEVDGTIYADTSILLYETAGQILGGQYAAAVTIPYVWMDVSGTVQLGSRLPPGTRSDTASGIGDIEFFPLMLGGTNGDLKFGGQLGVYAPTGEFEPRKLANIGKNFWTFEPGLNLSWLSSKIGTEVTLFAACDLNTRNGETDYQSGNVFHLDTTLAQHLPLGNGFIGAGANGFYYQQLTSDSGPGARLVDLESQTMGVGPVLSYATKLGGSDLIAEAKWLPELKVEKRLKGDIVWFKLALLF